MFQCILHSITDGLSAQKGYHDIAFGKSGAGAPRRTSKGKVNTHIIADPETHVPNVYRANPNIDTYVVYQ